LTGQIVQFFFVLFKFSRLSQPEDSVEDSKFLPGAFVNISNDKSQVSGH